MGKINGKFYCYWYTIGLWVEDDWSITFSGFPIMHKMFQRKMSDYMQNKCITISTIFTRADLKVS